MAGKIATIAFIAFMVATSIYVWVIDPWMRRRAVSTEAARLGLRFEARLGGTAAAAPGYLRRGFRDRICNVVLGERGALSFARYDYARRKFGADWLVVLLPDVAVPAFRVFRRDSADTWRLAYELSTVTANGRALAPVELDDQPSFAARYRLVSDNPEAIAAVFRAGFAAAIAPHTDMTVEGESGSLWIRCPPEGQPSLGEQVELGVQLAEALRHSAAIAGLHSDGRRNERRPNERG